VHGGVGDVRLEALVEACDVSLQGLRMAGEICLQLVRQRPEHRGERVEFRVHLVEALVHLHEALVYARFERANVASRPALVVVVGWRHRPEHDSKPRARP
jgi:hypothetical protein